MSGMHLMLSPSSPTPMSTGTLKPANHLGCFEPMMHHSTCKVSRAMGIHNAFMAATGIVSDWCLNTG